MLLNSLKIARIVLIDSLGDNKNKSISIAYNAILCFTFPMIIIVYTGVIFSAKGSNVKAKRLGADWTSLANTSCHREGFRALPISYDNGCW